MNLHRLVVAWLLLSAVSSASAEHRVALLINGTRELADALEARGFRCSQIKNSPELRKSISQFAAAAPTNGVALVYFRGQPRFEADSDDFYLTQLTSKEVNARQLKAQGMGVRELLELCHTKCGAATSLVLLDQLPQGQAKAKSKRQLGVLASPPAGTLVAASRQGLLASALAAGGDRELLGLIKATADAVSSGLTDAVSLSGNGTRAVESPTTIAEGGQAGDEWVNATGMVFCWCPPGVLERSSGERVEFKQGFWIGKYEVTMREDARRRPHRDVLGGTKNHPITMYNLPDAKNMARQMGSLPDGWKYALCREAEWEYAATGGGEQRHAKLEHLARLANFADKCLYDTGDLYFDYANTHVADGYVSVAPVGQFAPNPWGLHDVFGNVAEWCENGAMRGGSYLSPGEYCNASRRQIWPERSERTFLGYRVVITRERPNAK